MLAGFQPQLGVLHISGSLGVSHPWLRCNHQAISRDGRSLAKDTFLEKGLAKQYSWQLEMGALAQRGEVGRTTTPLYTGSPHVTHTGTHKGTCTHLSIIKLCGIRAAEPCTARQESFQHLLTLVPGSVHHTSTHMN